MRHLLVCLAASLTFASFGRPAHAQDAPAPPADAPLAAPAPAPALDPAPPSAAPDAPAVAPPRDESAAVRGPVVDEPPIHGFQLGARAGYVRALDSSSPSSLTYQTPSLLPIAIDLGYRTSSHIYLGLTVQLALASRSDCSGASGTCAAKEYRVGGTFQYHFSPFRGFDPWFGVGVGYENLHLTGFYGDPSGHITRTGLVLMDAQLGGDFALTSGARPPRLGPFVGLAIGSAGSETGAQYGKNVSRSPAADHQWATIGVRGTYDL